MKKITALLIPFFLCFFPNFIKGAHIIGGEVTYQCLSQGNYHITIKLYRDCNGGGAPFDSSFPGSTQGQVTIYKGDNPAPFRSVLLGAPVITPVDYDIDGCISDIPNLCVEQGVYHFNINLPVSDESYYIIYQRCCRNVTISNIQDPGETGATYMAEIHWKAQEVCNYGAEFNEFPPVLICANEPLVFDHSASDYEGDSLVYEFCSPLKGGDVVNLAPDPDTPPPHDPVDFVTPVYTMDTPLAGDPVVAIDAQTGIITGTPTFVGQFVIGVCVKEYQEGRLINIVQRDFQFNVTACNFSVQADLDGATDDGELFLYESCGDLEISMLNESFDLENIEVYRWEFDLGGGDSLISSEMDLHATFPQTGSYQGLMILNPEGECKDTAWIQVTIFELPAAEIEYDYDPCEVGPVEFTAIIPTSESTITSWLWDFGDGNTSLIQAPMHIYNQEGEYEISLTLGDPNGCTTEINVKIDWTIETFPDLESPLAWAGCAPLEVSLDHLSDHLDSSYRVIWDFGDNGIDSGLLVDYIYQNPGEYNLGLQIISASGCETVLAYENTILVEAPPEAHFEYHPNVVNKKEIIQFMNLSEREVSWAWDFGDGGTSEEEHPVWIFEQAENYEVSLIVEDQYGCRDTAFLPIEVRPVVNIFVPNAFSPNNDGVNDQFRTYPSCLLDEFQMKVFDRWGAQLFETNNFEEGWSGIHKDQLFDPGVFTWIVTFRLRDQVHMMRGDVTLLK